MPHHDTASELASAIANSRKHSLFEEEIRKLPIPVCSVFLDEAGKIRPAAFRETETVLPSKDQERTLEIFPITVGKNRNVVLEANSQPVPRRLPGNALPSSSPADRRPAVTMYWPVSRLFWARTTPCLASERDRKD